MTLAEAIAIVRRHNAWRRGDSSDMLPPTIIGQALDAICDHAERMERELVAERKIADRLAEVIDGLDWITEPPQALAAYKSAREP